MISHGYLVAIQIDPDAAEFLSVYVGLKSQVASRSGKGDRAVFQIIPEGLFLHPGGAAMAEKDVARRSDASDPDPGYLRWRR